MNQNHLNKYYFLDEDKNITRNKLIEIPCSVDVLMTYSSELLNTEMLIERSELYGQSYITDNQQQALNFPMILTREFSNGFDDLKYYLTVAGSYSDNADNKEVTKK